MKIRLFICCTLLLTVLLSACSPLPALPEVTEGSPDSTGELFTEPPAEEGKEPLEVDQDGYVVVKERTPGFLYSLGQQRTMGFLMDENMEDSADAVTYKGEELNFYYTCMNPNAPLNYGLLIFTDGRLQPYHTRTEAQPAYMYTSKPGPDDGWESKHFPSFHPISGKAGDKVHMAIANISYPEFFAGEQRRYWPTSHTGELVKAPCTITLKEDPSPTPLPETPWAASQTETELLPLTPEDREALAQAQEYEKGRVVFRTYMEGEDGNSTGKLLDEIQKGDLLTVTFELFGNDRAREFLHLFLDHQPVLLQGTPSLEVPLEEGKKTRVTVQIPLTDYDSRCVFYGILACSNPEESEARDLEVSPPYYISEQKMRFVPLGDMPKGPSSLNPPDWVGGDQIGVSVGLGPDAPGVVEEKGFCMFYKGEPMRIPFMCHFRDNYTPNGVLVYVDGKPQPYCTPKDPTYRYMHTIYPDNKGYAEEDLIFTPLCGKEGDELEIAFRHVSYPDYFPTEDLFIPMTHTFSGMHFGYRIKFETTPEPLPPEQLPVPPLAAESCQIEMVNMNATEQKSGETSVQAVRYKCSVNGKGDNTHEVCGVQKGDELEIKFMVYGLPQYEETLTIFLDNQPVLLNGETTVDVPFELGKKTKITIRVPVPEDYDGSMVFYGILASRNARRDMLWDEDSIMATFPVFITEEDTLPYAPPD